MSLFYVYFTFTHQRAVVETLSVLLRYVEAEKAGEYIRLIDGELGADSLEFSSSVSTYVLYDFKSLITTKKKGEKKTLILISCSFSSPASLHFATPSISLSRVYPREGHKLSSIPSRRVPQPDNPAARCPSGATNGGSPQRGQQEQRHTWRRRQQSGL